MACRDPAAANSFHHLRTNTLAYSDLRHHPKVHNTFVWIDQRSALQGGQQYVLCSVDARGFCVASAAIGMMSKHHFPVR